MSKNSFLDKYRKVVLYHPPVKIGSKYWFCYANVLYSYDESSGKINRECKLNYENLQGSLLQLNLFCYMENSGNKIILAPFYAKDAAVYDCEAKEINYINLDREEVYAWYRNIVIYGNKIFFLPGITHSDILVLEKLNSVRYIKLKNWNAKVEKEECTSEYIIQGRYLWVTAYYSNQVLKMDMDSERYELIEIDKDSFGFTGIALDNECLWLAESSTGALVQYDTRSGETKKYQAPEELDYNSVNKSYVHLNLFDFDKCIVSVPALSNKMTVLNKETGKIEIVKIDFFDSVMNRKSNYKYGNSASSSFGKKIDSKTLWVQRAYDGEIACINIDNWTYSTFSLSIKESEIYGQIYRSEKTSCYMENIVSPLESLLHAPWNQGETLNQMSSKVGADIWKKVKTVHNCGEEFNNHRGIEK